MTRPIIIYWGSCGLGENIQASPAMRWLKRTHHVIMVCREPTHLVVHPDCYDEMLTWTPGEQAATIHALKCRVASLDGPCPWTAHLDPPAWCAELEEQGFIVEARFPFPKVPCSASIAFYARVNSLIHSTSSKELLMSAAEPDLKREGDYDVLVCLGSGEKMRRLPEKVAIDLCNRLRRAGKRVGLVTDKPRPDALNAKVGCCMTRHGHPGTMEQLKELVWGVQTVISPDSGPVHLALAYGKRVVFLESREHARDVVDAVYDGKLIVVRMTSPKCDVRCHARREDVAAWPSEPRTLAGPGYPHGLACASEPTVPCLRFDPVMLEEICAFV